MVREKASAQAALGERPAEGGWQLLLYDIAVDTNPERSRSVAPASVRFGAIYTPREGCDIDVGYQARLNHAAPAAAWLAGLTVRW